LTRRRNSPDRESRIESKSKALGLAPSLEASGDKSKIKIVGGSDLCRIAFWQWVFTRIEVKLKRLDNEIGEILGAQLDAEKAAGRPV
jgi:hypothetical protein